MKLSAVVIALNEQTNIEECLKDLSFCDQVVVVDSGSQDRTVEMASRMGALVVSNKFEDFSSQKNYGLNQAEGDWVLLMDCDERVSSALADEIQAVIENPRAEGYYFLRKNNIFGRWMRWGSHQRDYQLRLVRKDKAQFQGLVHERIFLQGITSKLKNPLLHYSTKNISEYLKKLNVYTALEAKVLKQKDSPVSTQSMIGGFFKVLFYRLFYQAGWRDGREGTVFCVLSAYYEFIRRAKAWEIAAKQK